MDAFPFEAPHRTGPVLGTVVAHLPYPNVAVLDLLLVQKAPPKQSALFHAALDRDDVSLAFPILHYNAGSPDGVRRHMWRRRLTDHFPELATTSSTPFSEFPGG